MTRVKTDTLNTSVPREVTFNQGTLARYLQRVACSWGLGSGIWTYWMYWIWCLVPATARRTATPGHGENRQ